MSWLNPTLLTHDFSVRIQQGDDIRVGELAVRVLFVSHAQQRGQLLHIIRLTA